MIETALGVLESRLLAAQPGVRGFLFGAADYRESIRAGRSPEETELLFARSSILHAARSTGIEAFDTPWFEYKDLEGLEASAQRARLLGFDGARCRRSTGFSRPLPRRSNGLERSWK
jgi:citrate lyase subunit beta/citryl-CoA lyase